MPKVLYLQPWMFPIVCQYLSIETVFILYFSLVQHFRFPFVLNQCKASFVGQFIEIKKYQNFFTQNKELSIYRFRQK